VTAGRLPAAGVAVIVCGGVTATVEQMQTLRTTLR
jgi:hypothetical protein